MFMHFTLIPGLAHQTAALSAGRWLRPAALVVACTALSACGVVLKSVHVPSHELSNSLATQPGIYYALRVKLNVILSA